jgi:hypothetical protein
MSYINGIIGYIYLINKQNNIHILLFSDNHSSEKYCENNSIFISDFLETKKSKILLEEVPRMNNELIELWDTKHNQKLKNLYLKNNNNIDGVDIRPLLVPFSLKILEKPNLIIDKKYLNSIQIMTVSEYLKLLTSFFDLKHNYFIENLGEYYKNDILLNELNIKFTNIYKQYLNTNIIISEVINKNKNFIDNIDDILSSIMEWYIIAKIFFYNNNQKINKFIIHTGLYHSTNVNKILIEKYGFNKIHSNGLVDININSIENNCILLPNIVAKQFGGYKYKYLKYKMKYFSLQKVLNEPLALLDPVDILPIIDAPKETNMILYNIDDSALLGGRSYNIWPVISMKWEKNKDLLGIKSIDNDVKYKFIAHNIGEQLEPLLGKGGYSAVYDIEQIFPIIEMPKNHILKIYEKKSNITHLFNEPKVKCDMELYEKYFMKIFYYGDIDINENTFTFNDEKRKSFTKDITSKDYCFEYYISKLYQTAKIDTNGPYDCISELTNKEKYTLLIKNLIFLNKLQINNMFHSDYKIENIGWENNFDVIMIDYDQYTILEANNSVDLSFPTTFKPKWLRRELLPNKKMREYSYLIKWSVGGLKDFIYLLDLKFTSQILIELPNTLLVYQNRNIRNLLPSVLASDLHLDHAHYRRVPRYNELIEVFEWLRINNHLLE